MRPAVTLSNLCCDFIANLQFPFEKYERSSLLLTYDGNFQLIPGVAGSARSDARDGRVGRCRPNGGWKRGGRLREESGKGGVIVVGGGGSFG